MILRILLSLPLWLAYTALEVVLDVIGLFVIGGLALTQSVTARRSKFWPRLVVTWKGGWLTWLWGNEEDGVVGPTWWTQLNPNRGGRWLAFHWSALRNPVNNLRFVPGINPVIEPKRIKFIDWVSEPGKPDVIVVYTWQGIYSGLLILFPFRGGTFRFWLGWKLKPEDRSGVADTDMRKPRCGFAIQFKRVA